MASWCKYTAWKGNGQSYHFQLVAYTCYTLVSQLSSTVSNVTGLGTTVESVRTVADTVKDGQYYTKLDEHDLEWTCASGSSTENQVFYVTTKTGGFAFVQLIYSSIGYVWWQ